MDRKKLESVTTRAHAYLQQGRLHDALKTLRTLAEETMQWEVSDGLGTIAKNYAYMLRYLTDGMEDPQRDRIYSDLVSDIYSASDTLTRRLLMPDSPSIYFATIRNLGIRPRRLQDILDEYVKLSGAVANIVEQITQGTPRANRADMERAEREIFNYVWTVFPLTGADANAVREFLGDEVMPLTTKRLLVSGLVLGAMEFFDPARILLLMDIYDSDTLDVRLTSAALVGFLLAMFKFRNRPMPQTITDRLAAVSDLPGWQSDLKTAFLELIRTRDTERINRTMREDIIPGMMKMRPDIIRKMGEASFDPENPEANPEWEEMLSKSGLADKIRDLSELQQEGADVFMSTFSHLKSFPFFNEAANWFMPFDTERTDIAAVELPPALAELMARLPILCDSDKYSFFLSLNHVPQAQRRMMMSQFEAQNAQQLEEMMRAEASMPAMERRTAISSFLQNLYRFLNLFRRNADFYNPFAEGVNLLCVESLAPYLSDAETVRVVAEFFFRCGYWSDALAAFLHLDKLLPVPEGPVFQKIGYCYQKMGDVDKAIEYYHQAEYFDAESTWLRRRLAAAYRQKGDYAEAARYYGLLADADPDNADLALTIGYVLLQNKDYKGALKQFYKVEYLDENNARLLRPLAWTLFLTGDYEGARERYRRILENEPNSGDYLNMGHVAMALAQYKEAINFYKLSMNGADGGTEALIRNIRADADALRGAGVTDRVTALIIDALLYSLN